MKVFQQYEMIILMFSETVVQRSQQSRDAAFAELQAFVAVAEASSFIGASRRLGRDATVLSRRVAELETRLGVRLMERTTRSVALTEAGRVYLDRARAILQSLDEADREASSLTTGVARGHLCVSLPGTFGRMWLTPLITGFLTAHPLVTVEAEFSNRFVDLIGERFDLAVRLGELSDSRLMAQRIGNRRRLLCAAPSYLASAPPLDAPEDLVHHPCLVFTGLPTRERWELVSSDGETRRVAVRGRMISDEAEVLVEAAVAGLGVVLATDWLLGRALRAGALTSVLETWRVADEGAIYIVTPSGSGQASKTRAFANWIMAGLQSPPWRAGC
jgi:DNA-binding transcriptional LysR family regulator